VYGAMVLTLTMRSIIVLMAIIWPPLLLGKFRSSLPHQPQQPRGLVGEAAAYGKDNHIVGVGPPIVAGILVEGGNDACM
jgi:hypothetical protein